MKLAIIGSGPVALFAAAHFYNLGAHVVLFQRSPLGGSVRFMLKYDINANIDYPEIKSVKKFWEEDLTSLIEFVEEHGLTKAGEVLRVHKRFLHHNEEVQGRSRLADLFRVIYSINPKDSILKQVEENPEIFKQLGENVLNSLHEPVESFEDFDLVIEATGFGKSEYKMGPAGTFALNEKNLSGQSHFYYGKEFFKKFDQFDETIKTIALIGDDLSAELALAKLQDWLFKNSTHRLQWIRHSPISKLHLKDELDFLLKRAEGLYEEAKVKFENELRQWRDLEDYIKAKIPAPVEPLKKIEIFDGYNVTSVDKLLDRNGIFLTIESPDFRGHVKNLSDLRTLAVDLVVVENGVDERDSLGTNLTKEEPGYYIIHTNSLKLAMGQILEIEKDIMNFFSKSDQ